MRREHCDVDPGRADSKEWAASNRVWSTGNYHLSTTPRQEYRCAAFPSYHLSHHRFGPTLVRGMDYRGGPQAPVHNNARVPYLAGWLAGWLAGCLPGFPRYFQNTRHGRCYKDGFIRYPKHDIVLNGLPMVMRAFQHVLL